ncbi:MFS transporter [Oligoflexia bacterium]|nr:MFS transporter [Oligoflexia bacterium]
MTNTEALDQSTKRTLGIVFLTLFLDLVGFSIIFPMFPALLKHYLELDPENFFLRLILNSVTMLLSFSETAPAAAPIVLFGGALGALYSFLQFLCAPLWGALSDRFGRKPILLVSISGLALSYLLWFFSGSFTLLVIARLVGGIMGGNISVATAVVADVTTRQTRSKGMAIVGIAFALGFVIGPALGGLLTLVDLTALFPASAAFGVNPFSLPALLAFLLSSLNLYLLAKRFQETLPKEERRSNASFRSCNPFILFRPLAHPGVNLTTFGYFVFISAFSGMEFTLTFLAVEHFHFSPLENGYMFIFIGLVLAGVQGGVVRRYANKVGERRMALLGTLIVIPGLAVVGSSGSIAMLYTGLLLMSVGSALVIPCLTALISLYTPTREQGKALGIFRSQGALGRVLGPITASIMYWRFGASSPYFVGSLLMLIPILAITRLPAPHAEPLPKI